MKAGITWFRHFIGASAHVKVKRLARHLGRHPMEAAGWLFALWELVAKYAPASGSFRGIMEPAEIEIEIGWDGKAGDLIGGFTVAGLLDSPGLRVHDWVSHQPSFERYVEASSSAQRERVAEAAEGISRMGEPSAAFFKWWAMLPEGRKRGQRGAWIAWCKQGLEGEGPEIEAKREELYSTFAAQMNNRSWREGWIASNGTGLSYMRHGDWKNWKTTPPPDRRRQVTVPILDLPQRNDETDLRKDWEALPGSAGKAWPGYDKALAEVMASSRNKAPN